MRYALLVTLLLLTSCAGPQRTVGLDGDEPWPPRTRPEGEPSPPWTRAEAERATEPMFNYGVVPPETAEHNVLRITYGADCRVLINGERSGMHKIRTDVKRHAYNAGPPGEPVGPQEAVVIVGPVDPACQDQVLPITVEEVQEAYWEMWNEEARKRGIRGYEAYVEGLSPEQPDEIRGEIPERIYVVSPED